MIMNIEDRKELLKDLPEVKVLLGMIQKDKIKLSIDDVFSCLLHHLND